MGTLEDSKTICRLCSQENDETISLLFDTELKNELMRFLPIEVKMESPLPKVMCCNCNTDFEVVKKFMIKLNEGQALLAERLNQVDNIIIQMPNMLADKRPLFKEKYPCMPKALPKPRQTKQMKRASDEEIIVSEKRTRKMPLRLAESVQGCDLDNIFVKDGIVAFENEAVVEQKGVEISGRSYTPPPPIRHRGSGRQRNKCDICGKLFKLQGRLAHHRSTIHRGAFFQCCHENCGKQYKTRESIDLHHKTVNHSGSELIEPGKSSLHSEKKENVLSDNFNCQDCSRSFKNKTLLQRHMSTTHSDLRPYECDTCPLKFKSSTNLRAHQITHTGERKYSCEICGKLFGYKTSLIQHIKLHEGENAKTFACPHCQKRFTQKGNLEEHIRIHTGEKPFGCTVCDRRFTTSSQRKMHEKRHKGEKPFQCEECPKAFLHKESYKAHVRRHKGEKPFSCEFCTKAFTEVWALKKHQRLHTGEKPYKCSDCGKAFSDSSNLSKHSKTHVRAGDEVTTKDGTVWNIINQTGGNEAVEEQNDVQQIIYIAYDHDDLASKSETSVHIVSQTEAVPEDQAMTLPVTGFNAEASEAAPTTHHVISQEGLRLEDEKLDPNAQYIDLSIKDGEQVRLKVPLDADPMVYAKEYLQSLSNLDSGVSQ